MAYLRDLAIECCNGHCPSAKLASQTLVDERKNIVGDFCEDCGAEALEALIEVEEERASQGELERRAKE